MNTLNRDESSNVLRLIESLECIAEAGIDPAYDSGYEELEREYAEIRITFGND